MVYNINMRKYKSSRKSNSSKAKYTINPKSNVIFEDSHKVNGVTINFKIVSDSKRPFYSYNQYERK